MTSTAIYFREVGRDLGLLRSLKWHAKQSDLSLSAYVRRALFEHIDRMNATRSRIRKSA